MPIKDEYKNCLNCGEPLKLRYDRQVRFCSLVCHGEHKRFPFIIKEGYKRVICKGHRRANDHGYVREHILVMEKKIGRYIKLGEVVHHIDGNKLNNHPDNLELFSSHTEHMLHHWNEESLRKKNGKRTKSKE